MLDPRRDAGGLLLLAVLVLLPFGRTAELPLLLAALFGIAAMLRGQVDWCAPATRVALALFAGYWLPELLSAPDAVRPVKAWTEVAADLRWLPALLFATRALRDARSVRVVVLGVALLLGFWCLDALLQAASGWSLGGRGDGDRLSGIFGDTNLKLGGVVATLAPFGLLAVWHRYGARGALLAFVPILIVVLLAGARAAWLTLAIATALVLWHRLGLRRGGLALAATLALALAAALLANALSPRFAERVDRTAAAWRGDRAEIDHALAGRLPIWRTALAMTVAHPVNGVGVRGFRHAYAAHAAAGDPWIDPGSGEGALHAHQLLLELLSETGALGLLCWIGATLVALRAWRSASADARARAAAPAYALVATLFPLNTHYAVYSSFWALLLFALLALWLGALHARVEAA